MAESAGGGIIVEADSRSSSDDSTSQRGALFPGFTEARRHLHKIRLANSSRQPAADAFGGANRSGRQEPEQRLGFEMAVRQGIREKEEGIDSQSGAIRKDFDLIWM